MSQRTCCAPPLDAAEDQLTNSRSPMASVSIRLSRNCHCFPIRMAFLSLVDTDLTRQHVRANVKPGPKGPLKAVTSSHPTAGLLRGLSREPSADAWPFTFRVTMPRAVGVPVATSTGVARYGSLVPAMSRGASRAGIASDREGRLADNVTVYCHEMAIVH